MLSRAMRARLGVLPHHLGRVDLLDDRLDDASLPSLPERVVVGGTRAGVPERVPAVEVLAARLEVRLDVDDALVRRHVAADRQGTSGAGVLDVDVEAAHGVDEEEKPLRSMTTTWSMVSPTTCSTAPRISSRPGTTPLG